MISEKAKGKRTKAEGGALILCLVLSALVPPRQTGAQSAESTDAADPIRCWWRTSTGAVATGEPFEASLTCAVREDAAVRVVPDETRLGAAAIQLAPFEILGGSHPADLRTDTHRFFQYHYTVRVIDRDVIGRDAKFPDIQVTYRVHSRAGGASVEGRDRTYVLPGQPIRVLSLVPVEADDIRDSGNQSFAQVESLRFRSRALELVALALGALGGLVLAPAVLRLARRGSRTESVDAGHLPARRILAQVSTELDTVARARHEGWTPDLVARVASAVRLAAACALRRGFSQHPQSPAATVSSGHLSVRRGLFRSTRLAVSSPVTSADLSRELTGLPLTAPAEHRQLLEDLQTALTTLTAALYRPSFEADDAPLDEALAAATASVRRLKRVHAWPRYLLNLRQLSGRAEAQA